MKNERSREIVRAGWAFILTNLGLAVVNVVVGILSGAIAIVSDALHSLVDSISGILVVVTEKIASSKRYAASREKIERVATILIAIVIILVGVHIIHESIEKIAEPSEVEYSVPVIVILVASIAAKYVLARYLKETGRAVRSTVVAASGAETLNDCWISVAVLVSAVIYLIFGVDIEAYVSLLISLVIIKIGLEFIFPHLTRHHHHHLEENPDHDHCKKKPRR
ncbi:cation diffusion facilitator family transporter [Candidatus Saccharibacteria bacterium]|nr:cation diffusion facilitator family transporter [Candidatus Saccharibacteria bacterium]